MIDTLGQGPSAWHEQRYAEYDRVGLDMYDVVGHSVYQFDKQATPHARRWFRNVYTDSIGSMPQCDVAGGELTQPYVAPEIGCVRPQDQATTTAVSGDTAGANSDNTVTNATYDWDRGETEDEESGAAVGSVSMGVLLSFVVAAVMMVVF